MYQHRNYTLAEIEENELISRIGQDKMNLLVELLNICGLNIKDLCVHLDISPATFFRYKNSDTYISEHHYTHACVFFRNYMKEHKIAYTPKAIELIKATELFHLDEITKDAL